MERLTTLTDEELVQRAQAGDYNSEEFLIRKYKEMVKTRSRLYFMSGADGDDVMQEGMIGLFKSIRDFKGDQNASFKTFAEICVNRQIVSAIRSANRLKHEPLNASISLSNPVEETEGGETATTLQETLKASNVMVPEEELMLNYLMDAISSQQGVILSEFEKQVWQFYSRGHDYREIAAMLGKTPKATDNAIQRTKKKIMDFLCQ